MKRIKVRKYKIKRMFKKMLNGFRWIMRKLSFPIIIVIVWGLIFGMTDYASFNMLDEALNFQDWIGLCI